MVAFGKHPGWDDHIPDIGQMSPRLIEVKRVLYVEGIGGSIDSGTWEKLEEDQRLDGFNHLFLWRYADEVVAGRIWSSSDGKGRKRYPMIVCAQCRGLPVSWIISELLPRFEAIEQQCVATTLSSDVMSVIESSQAELQQLVQQANTDTDPDVEPHETLAWLADRPEMGDGHQGLFRLLYQVNPDAINTSGGKSKTSNHAKHVRVPVCEGSSTQIMLRWTRFMTGWVNDDVPFLMVLPLGQPWVDLLIGDQIGPRVFAIRVMPNNLPFTTEIPYNLDEAFVNKAQLLIAQSRGTDAADLPELAPSPKPPAPLPPQPPPLPQEVFRDEPVEPIEEKPVVKRSRLPKMVFIFIVLVAAVLVGLFFLNESELLDEKYKIDTGVWIDWLKEQLYWLKKHFY